MCGARLKHDDKNNPSFYPTKEAAEMNVWTAIIMMGFEQYYIYIYKKNSVMFTWISVAVL